MVRRAFFDPASDAILPEILASEQLGQRERAGADVRPLMLRLGGPALGGVLVAALGAGGAFVFDGVSFVLSAATLWAIAPRKAVAAGEHKRGSATAELREGWNYVRRRVWLWGTFASAAVAYLLFMGPAEVLLPFMVKHELGGGATQLGLVFGAGGLGSVACAAGDDAQRVAQERNCFHLRVLDVRDAGGGLLWRGHCGMAVDGRLARLQPARDRRHDRVGDDEAAARAGRAARARLEPRLADLDRLLPVSFALTAPVSLLVGARSTLVVAGVAGAAVTLGGLLLPGMRSGKEEAERGNARLVDLAKGVSARTDWALLISRSKACGRPPQAPARPARAAELSTTARPYARAAWEPRVARQTRLHA